MKYLFIFLLSILTAAPALAARQVPGTVPSVQPLQPIPAGVSSNPANNIQFHDASHEGDSASGAQTGESLGQNPASNASSQTVSYLPPLAKKTSGALWWLAAVLALIVLGWVWFKQRNSPQ